VARPPSALSRGTPRWQGNSPGRGTPCAPDSRVLETDAEPVAALDEEQAEAAGFDNVGGIRLQFAAGAFGFHGHRYRAGAQIENAGLGGSIGEHDSLAGSLPNEFAPSCSQKRPAHVSQPPSAWSVDARARRHCAISSSSAGPAATASAAIRPAKRVASHACFHRGNQLLDHAAAFFGLLVNALAQRFHLPV